MTRNPCGLEKRICAKLEKIDPKSIKKKEKGKRRTYELYIGDYLLKLERYEKQGDFTPDAEPYSDVLLTTRFRKVKAYKIVLSAEGRTIKKSIDSAFAKRMYNRVERVVREYDEHILDSI